jgi:hypothetical protein
MMYAWMSILYFAPILFVIIVSARAIWTCVTKPKRWRGEPACERCGYTVTGLAALSCPECGADLRRTGIITPAMELRRRGSLFGAILGWTMMILVAAYAGFLVWFAYAGTAVTMRTAQSQSTTTVLTETFVPDSGAFTMLRLTSARSDGEIESDSVDLVFTALDGRTSNLSASHSATGWTFYNHYQTPIDFTTLTSIGKNEINAIINAAGIPLDRPGAAEETDEILRLFQEKTANPPPATPPTPSTLPLATLQAQPPSTTVTSGKPIGIGDYIELVVGAGVGLLIWLGGLLMIVMKRRRFVRMAAAYENSAASSIMSIKG